MAEKVLDIFWFACVAYIIFSLTNSYRRLLIHWEYESKIYRLSVLVFQRTFPVAAISAILLLTIGFIEAMCEKAPEAWELAFFVALIVFLLTSSVCNFVFWQMKVIEKKAGEAVCVAWSYYEVTTVAGFRLHQ